MFNYSLKHITKYLYLKKTTPKEPNESNENFVKRIIRLFYKKQAEKMKLKIHKFYEEIFKIHNKDKLYSNEKHMEFQSLCKLRSYIFYNNKFIMNDLAKELLIFPMKYLKIVINDYDEFSFPQINMNINYSFKIEYNNNFTRIQINRIIEELFKSMTKVSMNAFKGSAEGSFLELKIDELFRNNSSHIFNLTDLEFRYLFSLITKTDNSDDTIKMHREEEKNLLFFGKENYNILIDDIDKDQLSKNHYMLNKNYYYFSQVSLNGKAFDMCIIVKDQDNKYKLYLFQVSKSKTNELYTKNNYLFYADQVAKNLKELYKIEITERHLIFILPKANYNNKFLEKLKEENFYYIFFDIDTDEFYNSKDEKIYHFDFPDSILNMKLLIDELDFKKINENYLIWQNSMKAYINKKRNNKKSLYDIYINELYNKNNYRLIKLDIKKINYSLLTKVIHNNKAILKFIGNCHIKNIQDIRNIHRIMFIFVKESEIYIDYDKLYQLKKSKNNIYQIVEVKKEKSEEMKKNEKQEDKISSDLNLDEQNLTIPSKSEKYSIIHLNDLFEKKNQKKYDKKCFCYLVITENILSQFYNWNC